MVVPDPGPPVVKDVLASLIRTAVPVVVGWVIAWLATRWLDLTAYSNAINAWLVPVCIAGYYTLVRLLEAKFPAFGWLLGLKAQPKYVTPAGQPIAPPPAEPIRRVGGHVGGHRPGPPAG